MLSPVTGLATPDADTILWRYMPLQSFLRFLQTSRIHFTRADQFPDPWEGVEPQPNLEQLKDFIGPCTPKFLQQVLENHHLVRKWVFINCWHEASCESAAM